MYRNLATSRTAWVRVTVFVFVITAASIAPAWANSGLEFARWQQRARNVTITRDHWGIAHVKGKTDADAIFGMIYAQAEDDFNRVETNYLNSQGRLAEAEGESAIWQDLRMKLFIDPEELKALYRTSPAWLKRLMDAWADGLNFYLATHPEVKPRVITRFEPWMALSFTEGSIGGDIESINLRNLQAFYDKGPTVAAIAYHEDDTREPREPGGSNGIAIAPQNTVNKKALLLINPHTSFFFRSELQMTSDEGLNAYGAVTWGQIFIYQGFNERLGWMHTSSSVDQIDEFLETVVKKGDSYAYRYGKEERPFKISTISVPYKSGDKMLSRTFTTYRSHHGPIIRATPQGKWVAVSLMHKPVEALTQSYTRTKARNYREFRQVMNLHANSSNNTIYADADGNIAYFHANYVPRRDTRFDWTQPVDGSDPATEYRGLHTVDESPDLLNPSTGWLYNTNNYPWSAAGPASRKAADFPKYFDNGSENARGLHAIMLLENRRDFTLEKLQAAAYDSYLTWFDGPREALVTAWDRLPSGDGKKNELRGEIEEMRKWDQRWNIDSVPTSLAVFWAEEIQRRVPEEARRSGLMLHQWVGTKAQPSFLLDTFKAASDRLTQTFGTWRTPWGEINRFQRISPAIQHPFSDAEPSIPVGFTSANWGSLASFGARPYRGSKRYYGTSGNSFVAVVEFGKKVRAKAVTAGGESGDPRSPHFNDQAQRYATGDLREVYFYPEQLKGKTERIYRPGQRVTPPVR